MNDNNGKRPSNFGLSRYLLNECTPDERHRIETWLASSGEARANFEKFKVMVAKEDLCAASLKPLPQGQWRFTWKSQVPLRDLNLSRPYWLKPAWAMSLCLAALVVVTVTVVVSRTTPFRGSGQTMQSSPVLQQRLTFRDSLESLFQVTVKALRQSEGTMQLADSQYQNLYLPPSDRQRRFESGLSRADLTSVHPE
jgi:anti-sigma factor RsiW